MEKTIIEDIDFGVDVQTLKKFELFEVPVDMVEAREVRVEVPVRRAPVQEAVEDYVTPSRKDSALMAIKEEVAADSAVSAFTYDGESYEIDPVSEWDLRIFEAQEEGRFVTSVKLLLGDKQWATFTKVKRTAKDLEGIFTAAQEALGFESGE